MRPRDRREATTPIVRGFGERLVKTTGDGVLQEFPAVIAAVECAILIQMMMAERNAARPEVKRILHRIGVNLGDVLIQGDDILGYGVNIAARLEGICEPAASAFPRWPLSTFGAGSGPSSPISASRVSKTS